MQVEKKQNRINLRQLVLSLYFVQLRIAKVKTKTRCA